MRKTRLFGTLGEIDGDGHVVSAKKKGFSTQKYLIASRVLIIYIFI